jgi:hypothetical protein
MKPVPEELKRPGGILRCETMNDLPLFNGKMLRDRGIEKVSVNNESWMDECERLARKLVHRHSDFTGEDIRFFCQGIVDEPKSPNAWGALIKTLIKRKVIVPTGRYVNPKDRASHARKIQVYEAYNSLGTETPATRSH